MSGYENKRFWVNAYKSFGYGHPDIQHLPGANDCTPLRFERLDVCKLPDTCKTTVNSSENIEDCIEIDIEGVFDDACINNSIVDESLCVNVERGIKRKLEDVCYNDSKRK